MSLVRLQNTILMYEVQLYFYAQAKNNPNIKLNKNTFTKILKKLKI